MSFSITRMLFAVTAFSMAFGAFSYLGVAGTVVSSVIGFCTGLICLIVKRNQVWPLARTVLLTITGGFAGLISAYVFAPYGDKPIALIGIGVVLGFFAGVSKTAFDNNVKKLQSKFAENEISSKTQQPKHQPANEGNQQSDNVGRDRNGL